MKIWKNCGLLCFTTNHWITSKAMFNLHKGLTEISGDHKRTRIQFDVFNFFTIPIRELIFDSQPYNKVCLWLYSDFQEETPKETKD